MRRISILLAAVLLVSLFGFAPGTVALAAWASPAPMNALLVTNGMPQAGPNGFIAPISPRDPNAKPISTVAQLRSMVAGGNYYLTQDIDLGGYNGGIWKPLTVSVTLDGQGHVIRNLHIPASARQRAAGLFGVVLLSSKFTVRNLGVQLRADGITAYNALAANVVTEYPVFAGGLVGVADSQAGSYAISFSNCFVSGDVTGAASGANQCVFAGGLAGMVVGAPPISIVNCYTTGHVRSTSDREESSIGGLAGSLRIGVASNTNLTVNYCYSSCDVSAMNGDIVKFGIAIGGLVGSVYKGTITNSHAAGAVSAKASNVRIGGLVGTISESVVNNCRASGNVSVTTPDRVDNGFCSIEAGGLAGYARCTTISTAIARCFSTGAVNAVATNNSPTGATTGALAGGLIGVMQVSDITDCYATGAANAAAKSVTNSIAGAGGIAGSLYDNANITKCYATGLVSATKTLNSTSQKGLAGGVAGEIMKSSGISNCYFNNQTTGQAQAIGNDGAAAPNAGKTTAQMKAQATYTGWNFISVWGISSERNNGYPYLRWQYVRRVFFDSQGGSAVASAEVQSGAKISRPTDPTRMGYTFGGWYKQAACTAPWNFATDKVTGDTTLYAKWTPFATPASLKATATAYNSVKVTWGTVTGAGGYEVWRSTTSAGGYKLVATVAGTSSTSTGLATGTTYYYKIRAYRTVNGVRHYSAYTAAASAKPVLSAATGLKAARVSATSIRLTWYAVAGVTKYEVYRAASASGAYTKLTEVTSAAYTNTGLTTGKTYYYKVRAYRLVVGVKVYGGYSAVVSAKP